MRVLYPEIFVGKRSSEVMPGGHSSTLDSASVVKQHAFNLWLGGRIKDVLIKPLGIKTAAAAQVLRNLQPTWHGINFSIL